MHRARLPRGHSWHFTLNALNSSISPVNNFVRCNPTGYFLPSKSYFSLNDLSISVRKRPNSVTHSFFALRLLQKCSRDGFCFPFHAKLRWFTFVSQAELFKQSSAGSLSHYSWLWTKELEQCGIYSVIRMFPHFSNLDKSIQFNLSDELLNHWGKNRGNCIDLKRAL